MMIFHNDYINDDFYIHFNPETVHNVRFYRCKISSTNINDTSVATSKFKKGNFGKLSFKDSWRKSVNISRKTGCMKFGMYGIIYKSHNLTQNPILDDQRKQISDET